ncbi:MAG: hypothetical protein VKL42_13925 [Snowella sp.]|nr:hypothetical protein [Snowella sp.]
MLLPLNSQAESSTRISIAKGKDCAVYRGNVQNTKTFVMKIKPYDEQLLYIYSPQMDQFAKVTVRGSLGNITPQESIGFGITETNQVYPIHKMGDYHISLTVMAPVKTINFCVIDNPNGERP